MTWITATASLAHAQKIEVGASLANATIGLGDQSVSTFGVPSGGFGLLNPGAYASFFLGSHVAIEPQLGFVWASFDGESDHLLNFVGQFDYFVLGSSDPSPYVFVAAGVLDSSDDYSPKSIGAGVGYRMLVGDRLAFRLDGRYTHFTSEFEDSNTVAFTLSIGGVFGER